MKLSVIVPIYGVEKYLRQALDSLKAQSVEGVEFILVDDGSKDGCGAIVDEYAEMDKRFTAIHQANGGYGKAVNNGMKIATGEYVTIFEPDDWVESDFYEGLMKRAEETDADVVKTGITAFYEDTNPIETWGFSFDGDVKSGTVDIKACPKLFSIHPSIWSCVYKREFLEMNGIAMEETPGASWQDNLFQVKTMGLAKTIAFAPGAGYHYRDFRGKKPPKGERILEVVRSIRAWLKENNLATPEILAAQSMRELSYVGLAFDWRHPFQLMPVMRRVTKGLRGISGQRIRDLGILENRLRSRYRWARAGAFPGLLRQALPWLRYWAEAKLRKRKQTHI